jgi:fatty acid desaturase
MENKNVYHFVNKVRFLKNKSNFINFLFIFLDYLLILSSVLSSIYLNNFFVYLLSIMVIGSRMRALENLVHEASHFQLFRNKKLNDLIGMFLCAFPIVSSLLAYRKSHLNHHRYFGNKKLDPDLIRYKKMGIDSSPIGKRKFYFFLLKVFLLINTPKYILGTVKSFIYNKEVPFYEPINRIFFYITLMLLLFYFDLWKLFLLYWMIPFFTTFQIIRQMSEISEHGGIYEEKEFIKMTRNNFCHPILKFLIYPHNDFCHLVHHLAPFVAHYNLPRAHNILCSESVYASANNCYGYFKKLKFSQKSTTIESILYGTADKKNHSVSEADMIDTV